MFSLFPCKSEKTNCQASWEVRNTRPLKYRLNALPDIFLWYLFTTHARSLCDLYPMTIRSWFFLNRQKEGLLKIFACFNLRVLLLFHVDLINNMVNIPFMIGPSFFMTSCQCHLFKKVCQFSIFTAKIVGLTLSSVVCSFWFFKI